MWHDEREITPSRPGLAKGQCARESARPGILGQGRGKTCRTGVGTCGGIGSPSSFSRLKTASRSSRLPFLLPSGRILTFILPFHTRAVDGHGRCRRPPCETPLGKNPNKLLQLSAHMHPSPALFQARDMAAQPLSCAFTAGALRYIEPDGAATPVVGRIARQSQR